MSFLHDRRISDTYSEPMRAANEAAWNNSLPSSLKIAIKTTFAAAKPHPLNQRRAKCYVGAAHAISIIPGKIMPMMDLNMNQNDDWVKRATKHGF